MLRRVVLVQADVSEERSVSIIRVTRIGKLGTTLTVTSNRHKLRINMPQNGILHSHRLENFKSYFSILDLFLDVVNPTPNSKPEDGSVWV
jgi:hypothetical protein